jgi:hypothetical protein
MKKLTIYIASSWKNQHGVEMLTELLRRQGHEVKSFVENGFGECNLSRNGNPGFNFEEWVNSYDALKAFKFDTDGAMSSHLVVYYGPSGNDSAAEVGIAWAKGVPIMGLDAKGEDFGLMRKLISQWYVDHKRLLKDLEFLTKDEDTWKVFLRQVKENTYTYKDKDGWESLDHKDII